ncbi:MAG: hypothetical protein LBT94_07595 [Prevotellaceae bacterium]|jgi:hypothetical protein|nr:hypothetical protein [Prevotellaceae bacterium]
MRFAVIFLLVLSVFRAQAQYVSQGVDPAGEAWSHIRTPHFDVIFPDSARRQGEHFTRLLNRVYLPASSSLGFAPRRIPVILHPYNLQSNGMVVWAPSRMEILSTAPTDGYAQPWLEQLALHEYRHVAQTDMMNCGFTRALYYLLGEQAVALPAALIKPWLFEGDAVGSETAMSFAGRGRMASFDMGLRAIVLDQKKYSYDKLLLGSLKDYIPNHYEYGYQMAAYGRYRYGADLWGKVFRFTGKYPFLIFTQSIASKKYTGKWSKGFHSEAMLFLDSLWRQEQPQHPDAPAPLVGRRASRFSRYESWSSPAPADGGAVWAVKSALRHTPKLMKVDSAGRAKPVASTGKLSSRLAGGGNVVYWTEFSPDLRWEQRSYSELWRYDARRKKTTRLTRRTTLFTPAVSPTGKVAASEKYASGEQAVVLLDSSFRKSAELFRFPLGESVNDLAWIDSQAMAVLYTTPQGMGIGLLSAQSRALEPLLPCTYTNISGISAQGGLLLFSSGYSGVDNIYALDVQRRSVHRLTNVALGALEPLLTSDKNRLIFASYASGGATLASLPTDSLLWQKTAFNDPFKFTLAERLSQQEQFRIDTAALDAAPLTAKKYRKAAHLFRFHSWAPMAYSPSDLMGGDISAVAAGVTLLSQNNLSSAVTSLRYRYDRGFSSAAASIAYTGWFPVVEVSGSYGSRYNTYIDVGGSTFLSAPPPQLYGAVNAAVSVPLNLSAGNAVRTLTPYVRLTLSNDKVRLAGSPRYTSLLVTSVGFSAQTSTRTALRDINPRWGLSLAADVQGVPAVQRANQKVNFSARAYTPSFVANHSIRLYAGYEQQRTPLMFITRIAIPRGFAATNAIAAPRLTSYSASYALPVWYPDISVGALAYVKRIRVNFFGDRMALYSEAYKRVVTLDGAGYELLCDFHPLRFAVLVSAGWRQTVNRTASAFGYQPAVIPVELLLSFSY